MHTFLASVLIFLASVIGSHVQPSQPHTQPASIECMEDMPCWDAATEGVTQPSMSPSEVAAWTAIEDVPLTPSVDNQRPVYAATMHHQPAPDSLPIGYFVIADDQPHVFHMFQWVTFYDA